MPEPMILAGVAQIPLSRAVLCLDCEAVSDRNWTACPTCGSHARHPLAAWLQEHLEAARDEEARPRASPE